jgi:hypothetical protein
MTLTTGSKFFDILFFLIYPFGFIGLGIFFIYIFLYKKTFYSSIKKELDKISDEVISKTKKELKSISSFFKEDIKKIENDNIKLIEHHNELMNIINEQIKFNYEFKKMIENNNKLVMELKKDNIKKDKIIQNKKKQIERLKYGM